MTVFRIATKVLSYPETSSTRFVFRAEAEEECRRRPWCRMRAGGRMATGWCSPLSLFELRRAPRVTREAEETEQRIHDSTDLASLLKTRWTRPAADR